MGILCILCPWMTKLLKRYKWNMLRSTLAKPLKPFKKTASDLGAEIKPPEHI